MEALGQCSVFKCMRGVASMWSTGETDAELAEWGVCLNHFERMRRGEDWATHTDLPKSGKQSIVMGDDLDVRTSETLRGWRLSLEWGNYGRHIRLALSSQKDEVGVLLDSYDAHQLSKDLAELSKDDSDSQQNWAHEAFGPSA